MMYEYNIINISILFKYFSQHYFICRTSGSTVSEDAGIEPRKMFWHWQWDIKQIG